MIHLMSLRQTDISLTDGQRCPLHLQNKHHRNLSKPLTESLMAPILAMEVKRGLISTAFQAAQLQAVHGQSRSRLMEIPSCGDRRVHSYQSLRTMETHGQHVKAEFHSVPPVADRVNPNKFYAYNGADGQLWVSTDKGQTFTKGLHGLPIWTKWSPQDANVSAVPGFEGDLWICCASGGLYRSTNSGDKCRENKFCDRSI